MVYRQSVPFNQNVGPQVPGSEKYWCETCDKGFMTRNHLNYHKQRHQKCNINGCQFVAHPQVITKHIQMQHASGLYKRIGKLNNPEEIKKWREERKRKYPTKENIEKRQAEIKEKIRRGEKMGLKRSNHGVNNIKCGFNNKKQQYMTREKYMKTLNDRKITPQLPNKKRTVKKIVHKVIPPKEETRKIQPFRGIQDIVADDVVEEEMPEVSNNIIEDEDVTDAELVDKTITKPTLCGALTSLISNYESSDEDTEIDTITKPTTNINNLNTAPHSNMKYNDNKDFNVNKEPIPLINENRSALKPDNNLINNPNESENESGPEETTVVKVTKNDETKPVKHIPTKKERLQMCAKARSKIRPANLRRKLPSTLLEKLLHREIQHERNVILQCVRFVVENKYFDKVTV
nr:nuclear fragile X mental retardation-interacting protein 1 [Vanessa tameamea]